MVYGPIRRRGPQAASGSEKPRFLPGGFIIAIAIAIGIAIAIETRVVFGFQNMDGEPVADRNVCHTRAGVDVSGPHLGSAGIGVGVGVGIGIEWNDKGLEHAKPDLNRTATCPMDHRAQPNDTDSDADTDSDPVRVHAAESNLDHP
jgi:hypothetical protein